MNISRRNFLKVAVGAGAALLVPERKVWALDRTMIPANDRLLSKWVHGLDDFPRTIRMGDYAYEGERIHPTTLNTRFIEVTAPSLLQNYDIINIDGQNYWIAAGADTTRIEVLPWGRPV